jgi:hypothetical protein
VAHQLAQHQQVDPGRGQLGAVGVTQPVWPHPQRSRTLPVVTEQASHPGFGHRAARRRPVQHHEALRCSDPRRPLGAQVGGELDEERPVDRDDPLPLALADHGEQSATEVDIRQPQPADLAGT